MKIQFLGSGSAFVGTDENYQSNILISSGEYNLLYDAGTTIAEALKFNGVDVNNIQNIFISHLHADHAGGMEYIGFKRYFSTFPFGNNKPTVISAKAMLSNLWKSTLSGGMKRLNDKVCKLSTFFNLAPAYKSFNIGEIECELVSTPHVKGALSYGLLLGKDTLKVFISGDTQFDDSLLSVYNTADVIFQDCEFANYPGSVHAQFNQLCTLPDSIKEKMHLYHYMLNGTFESMELMVKQAGFAGLVQRGQKFNIM